MKLIIGFAVFIFTGLIVAPSQCLAGAGRGLSLCANVIIPSLFPFFVCSKLFIETGAAAVLGKWCGIIMRPLFNVPGSAGFAFVLGILSGYPVGAQCGVDLYEKKLCTKAEAQRIVCFCNNSGPLFVIGSVGVGMMYSQFAGVMIYIIHIMSAISTGIVLRFYKRSERITLEAAPYNTSKVGRMNFGNSLSDAIVKSVELTLYVCGFIVFFSAFLVILEYFGVIAFMQGMLGFVGISPDVSKALSFGFFELTNGAVRVAALPIGHFRIVLVSMLIAWSGLSVILQVSGILSKSGLSSKVFIGSKFLQSIFAGVYALILVRLPIGSAEAFASHSSSVTNIWLKSLTLVGVGITVIFFISLACLIYINIKKRR